MNYAQELSLSTENTDDLWLVLKVEGFAYVNEWSCQSPQNKIV